MNGYLLLTAADCLIGFQFLFNKKYVSRQGGSVRASLVFNLISYSSGIVILFAINRFTPEFTLFTLLTALWSSVNNVLFMICAAKALSFINLSLYSVFTMLGGMTLPFIGGLLFFDEKLTPGMAVCFAATAASLFISVGRVKKQGERTAGKRKFRPGPALWYAGLFVLNGMNGIISKVFTVSGAPKTSTQGYSVLCAALMLALSGILLPIVSARDPERRTVSVRPAKSSVFFGLAYGICSNVANLLILLALREIPASAQYPFVTGGSMIACTIIGFFTPDKPRPREIAAVATAFAGIMALMFL